MGIKKEKTDIKATEGLVRCLRPINNPSTSEVEAGGLGIQGEFQPFETSLSYSNPQNKTNKKKTMNQTRHVAQLVEACPACSKPRV